MVKDLTYLDEIGSLKDWKDAWVKHPLRTEQNLSPEQLWTTGFQAFAG